MYTEHGSSIHSLVIACLLVMMAMFIAAGSPVHAQTQETSSQDTVPVDASQEQPHDEGPLQQILESAQRFWEIFQQVWDVELWVIDQQSVTIKKVIIAVIILFLGLFFARAVLGSFRNRILKRTKLEENIQSIISKLIYYFILLFVFLFALRMVNIPLTAFAFLGGAIAIGFGFGAQNLINNFISGFILMVERPIKIGDVIEMDNSFGVIENIGARCTVVRTFDNARLLVPNSSFLEKNITNWTMHEPSIRTNVTVGVAYGSDVKKVRDLLFQAVHEHPDVMKTPDPFVLFSDFGDNSLVFKVYFWVWLMRWWRTQSDLRFRIDELFRDAGIVIAFPQRDTHIDFTTPLKIEMAGQDSPRDS
ncbi:MAG: mechanosensitive ion channel family protein [Desulfomonilia bacterium]